jgi:hypothetical protein
MKRCLSLVVTLLFAVPALAQTVNYGGVSGAAPPLSISGATNNQCLIWSSTALPAGAWINGACSTGGLAAIAADSILSNNTGSSAAPVANTSLPAGVTASNGSTILDATNTTPLSNKTVSAASNHIPGFVINVIDPSYGANPNGIADSTAAIALAIAAIPSTGATLLFPPGNYLISGSNALPSNTHVRCEGATITAAPYASWSGGAVGPAFWQTTGTNFEVSGCNFVFPNTIAGFGSGSPHTLQFAGVSHVFVHDNFFNGSNDSVANIGSTDVWVTNNSSINMVDGCYDNWGGFTDTHINFNYCSIKNTAASGADGISFTGINTDSSAANSIGFEALGNTIHLAINNGAQCVAVNGYNGGGSDNRGVVANNRCVLGSGVSAWGYLVMYTASNIDIHDNYCEGDGVTVGAYSCAAAYTPATNVLIHHNIAYKWWSTTANSIFSNTAVGGTLEANEAYTSLIGTGAGTAVTAANMLGYTAASTLIAGNDVGSGAYNFATLVSAKAGLNITYPTAAASTNGLSTTIQGQTGGSGSSVGGSITLAPGSFSGANDNGYVTVLPQGAAGNTELILNTTSTSTGSQGELVFQDNGTEQWHLGMYQGSPNQLYLYDTVNSRNVWVANAAGALILQPTSGLVEIPTIASDATHTDASVCVDTTSHALYYGSGTIGICLGTSSERFKHGIEPLDVGLKQIEALTPVSYYLNADHGDPDHQLYGFTAEGVAPVLPTLVGLDSEGKPNTADYVGLIPVLVKAMQEQQAEIKVLKRQLRRRIH